MEQEKIGKFINELRKERGLTQEQLAEKMGVTDKSVSRWENGKTLPDITLLIQLSDILNTTLPELLRGEKLSKDELIKQKELIENVIKYDTDRKNEQYKKAMTKLGIGLFITALGILNNYIPYLSYIFKPDAQDFVQGFMYGIGIGLEIISSYNLMHDLSLRERKKQLIKKSQKRK